MHGRFGKHTADTLLAVSLLLTFTAAACADAGANAAVIGQQVHIVVGDESVEIEYVTQLNRPAAFAEVLKIDTDRDGRMTTAEQSAYFQQLAEKLRRGLEVRVDGRTAELKQVGDVQLEMPFRKTYRYRLTHPHQWQQGAAVELHNENYLDYAGPLEITLQPGDAIDIVYDSLAAEDAGESGPLLPDPALAGLEQQRDILFCYRAGNGQYEPQGDAELASRLLRKATEENDADDATLTAQRVDRRAVLIWIAACCLFGGGVIALRWRRAAQVTRLVLATTLLLAGCAGVCVAAFGPDRQADAPQMTRAEAAAQFQRLHRSVYRAFRQRNEEGVYDALAECLSGDALDVAYNEVYEAVLDRDSRGTRFSVRRVKPIKTVILPPDDSSGLPHYRVRYRWRVAGTVTHFNHTHARINEYEATYTVSLHDAAWRITDVQMRQHKRLSMESSAGRD